jgi:acetyltransferase-like isoleucine patch superfamily enzyme
MSASHGRRLTDCGDGPHVGRRAVIFPSAKIIHPDRLWIGDHSTIDDFVFLNSGRGTRLGRYVHVGCHASVIGGGELEIDDYGVIATGARILTGTDTFTGGARMSTHLPPEFRHVVVSKVTLGRDAFVGANAVVMPGVTLGEGAVAGAGAVVTDDLKPWTVYTGSPARRQSSRPRPERPGP